MTTVTDAVRSEILEAAKTGNVAAVDRLARENGNGVFRVADAAGNTPMHWACYQGQTEVVEAIIDKLGIRSSADPIFTPKSNDGYTPMHYACYNGQREVVEAIIDKLGITSSADPIFTAKANDGGTPLEGTKISTNDVDAMIGGSGELNTALLQTCGDVSLFFPTYP